MEDRTEKKWKGKNDLSKPMWFLCTLLRVSEPLWLLNFSSLPN